MDMNQPRLEGVRSKTLKELFLNMDTAARKQVRLDGDKFVITSPASWLKASKNGFIFAEKENVIVTVADGKKKELKANVQLYIGAKGKPNLSHGYISYYKPDGSLKKDQNDFLVCDTPKGKQSRNVFFRRRVENKGFTANTIQTETAPF